MKYPFQVAFKVKFHINACLYILFLTNAADLMTAYVGCPCPLDREAFFGLMSDDFLWLRQLVRPLDWKINLFYDVEMAGDGFWR